MPTPAIRHQVIASSLNLRDASSITANILQRLPKGTRVTALEASPDGAWLRVKHERRTGWVSAKYLQAVPGRPTSSRFPWYDIARGELGVQEVAGPGSNPRIVEYLRSTTLDSALASTDATAWCSAFANWCVERAGHAGTDSAWAKSWQHWGRALAKPSLGCVVVLTRDVDRGHVGFFVSATATHVRLLGGNQANRVCEADFALERLIGYRAPA